MSSIPQKLDRRFNVANDNTLGIQISPKALRLIEESFAIEAEDARAAGAIGYMARVLVQTTLPHSNPGEVPVWGRENGHLSLTIQPGFHIKDGTPVNVGLPYGNIPRLVLAWLTTEAVRTKEPTILLGDTLASFMRELEMTPTGGRWGSITRLREQMKRLFSSSISCTYSDEAEGRYAREGMQVAKKVQLWWDPKKPEQAALWHSEVELSQDFFDEVTHRPVPVDMRALKALRRSPLSLDLYCWLTYRLSYLRKPTTIPWEALQFQFGSDYGELKNFKYKLTRHLRDVLTIYTRAKVTPEKTGLVLSPSPPHVARLPR